MYSMRRTIIKTVSTVLTFFLFVSASKPSLDGRAVVAGQGELPPGLYVKAAAFLPGDTVLITNPAAKVSIEALVFATFSASDGIAVVLSPEAAKLLFIAKDSNSIVQITKNGSDTELAVLSKALDDLPVAPKSETNSDDSVLYADYVKNEAKTAQSTAGVSDQETALSQKAVAEDPSVEPVAEVAQKQSFSDSAAEESAAESVQTDKAPVEVASGVSDQETALSQKAVAEDPSVEPVAEVAQKQSFSDSAAEESAAESVQTDKAPVEVAADDSGEENVFTPFADQSLEVVQSAADTPKSEVVEQLSAVEPNILVEAEDNPPEAVQQETEKEEILPDYFAHSQQAAEPIFADEAAFAPQYENIKQHVIANIEAFGAGTYCIQLATYRNPKNIDNFIDKYAGKYPVRLVVSEKISGAYQVLIGPLNKDEYPVVLKRFVSWGFKDAFLREVR